MPGALAVMVSRSPALSIRRASDRSSRGTERWVALSLCHEQPRPAHATEIDPDRGRLRTCIATSRVWSPFHCQEIVNPVRTRRTLRFFPVLPEEGTDGTGSVTVTGDPVFPGPVDAVEDADPGTSAGPPQLPSHQDSSTPPPLVRQYTSDVDPSC